MNQRVGEKISVCLLTYNHVEVIESTLRSILSQTITGYEIIVSDDCSTDGTWDRILELASDDSRIKPVRTPHNLGMPGNANYAAALSQRPYIALLHHDDLYREDLLEKWSAVLERYADTMFVFNSYGIFGGDSTFEEEMPDENIDGKWLLEHHLFAHWGCVVRGTAMIRRRAWERVGGMRVQFGLLADVDLWMRLAVIGAVGYVPEPVITVRHQRPNYYPDIYKATTWSWKRQKFLYEIHATNRLDYLMPNTPLGRLRWWGFRLKLSVETAKWLAYAVVRKKRDMIISSNEAITRYDVWPLGTLRRVLQWVFVPNRDLPR